MDKVLNRLINTYGVSGSEEFVRNIIREELKECGGTLKEDRMGNLIVKLGQGKEKMMFCAHMDQIGIVASFIEDNGFIRVGAIGDFKTEDVIHTYVRFKNGTLGKLASNKDELFVDIGIKGRENVINHVKEGDTACFVNPLVEIGEDIIIAPNLDNRIGCFILISVIKEIAKMENIDKELYFVFSSQEELGSRGSRAAAYNINPDYCIVVDVENAGDIIGGEGSIKLQRGPVIKVMDKTLIINHVIKDMLLNAAKKSGVDIQYAITSGNSDGSTIHKERGGIRTGEISIPCRYKHSISEMVSLKDVEDTIKLLLALL